MESEGCQGNNCSTKVKLVQFSIKLGVVLAGTLNKVDFVRRFNEENLLLKFSIDQTANSILLSML